MGRRETVLEATLGTHPEVEQGSRWRDLVASVERLSSLPHGCTSRRWVRTALCCSCWHQWRWSMSATKKQMRKGDSPPSPHPFLSWGARGPQEENGGSGGGEPRAARRESDPDAGNARPDPSSSG